MYTIKQASSLTGIRPDTLRKWDQRYQFGTASRTESGYRIYDDSSIATLRAVRRLVDHGWAAGRAVELVRSGQVLESAEYSPEALLNAFLKNSVTSYQFGAILNARSRTEDFPELMDTWLFPFLGLLGQAWMDGRLNIEQEHQLAEEIQRQLAVISERCPEIETAPNIAVGIPEGAQHQVGARAFATALRVAGLRVSYLSTMPTRAWVHTAETGRYDGVAISVPLISDVTSATTLLSALGQQSVAKVFVGGGFQDQLAHLAQPLGQSFSIAVPALVDAVFV